MEQLTDSLISKANKNCRIHTVGFSQGTATVSRWLLSTKHSINSLILWGGKIANDFDCEYYNRKHSKTKTLLSLVKKMNSTRKKLSMSIKKNWLHY